MQVQHSPRAATHGEVKRDSLPDLATLHDKSMEKKWPLVPLTCRDCSGRQVHTCVRALIQRCAITVLSPVIMPPYEKYHPGGLHEFWKLAERQGRELERTSERLTYIRSNVFLPAGMTHDECTACCEFISPNMCVPHLFGNRLV